MTIKLYQNITKGGAKKGELYYTCKADQSGTLYVEDGRYSVKEDKDKKQFGMLSLSLKPTAEGDYEVLHFVDGKVQPTQPYEWPLTVHIKCNFTDGTTQEKAIHKLFISTTVKINDVAGGELAKGFAGELTWADTPGVKRISTDNPREHDWQSFADIVAKASAITDADIPAGGGMSYGGGAKGQTETEKLADRLAYLKLAITPESPESVLLIELADKLAIDKYLVVQILFS